METLTDRDRAILQARQFLETEFVVLDTETTGLEDDDEAVQVAVVSGSGEILVDSLIRPHKPISPSAAAIHGITDEMVQDAPGFEVIYPRLVEACAGKGLVIYNLDFDWRILERSIANAFELNLGNWDENTKVAEMLLALAGDNCMHLCAMKRFAAFYGEWGRRGYRWKSLTFAARHLGVNTGGAHGAAADALMTLRVVEGMARANTEAEENERLRIQAENDIMDEMRRIHGGSEE